MSSSFPWSSTHPFISFSFNVERLTRETWALLGECSSKIDHISGIPLKPATERRMMAIYLARGAHGTTAIEGNTLSETEVSQMVAGALDLPDSMNYQKAAVKNILDAYNRVIGRLENEAEVPGPMCEKDLQQMNREVLNGLPVGESVVPGEFRDHTVVVNRYRSPGPADTCELLDHWCTWMNAPEWRERTIGPHLTVPIIKAVLAHLYFAWIHPFGDGNGRTARLVEFDLLTREGVPLVCAHLMADYYNRTREEYYRALDAAQRDAGLFVAYAVRGFAEGLREQLKMVLREQHRIAWESFVYEVFSAMPHSATNRRRRLVALTLAFVENKLSVKDIPKLSVDLAKAYGDEERKVYRDVAFLQELGLLVRDGQAIAANTAQIAAFTPYSRRV